MVTIFSNKKIFINGTVIEVSYKGKTATVRYCGNVDSNIYLSIHEDNGSSAPLFLPHHPNAKRKIEILGLIIEIRIIKASDDYLVVDGKCS